MASWTTTELLNAVKARAGIPASNDLISDTEILEIANEVMDTLVAEALRSAGGRYGIQVATDAAITNGTSTYALPTRAMGSGAISVWYVDSTSANVIVPMEEIPPSEAWRYMVADTSFVRAWAAPYAYCLEGDSIRLLPSPTATSGYIRIKYYERPGRLVATSRCGPFTATSLVSKTITIDTSLQAAGSLVTTTNAKVDLIRGEPPFDTISRGLAVSSYAAPTLTMVDQPATTTSLTASDNRPRSWVCPIYESCVPQIPVETHALLIAGTCRDYCEAIRDAAGASMAKETVDRQLAKLRTILEPRVRSAAQVIINHNSPLRSGGRWSR